jgi:hypothetical protein
VFKVELLEVKTAEAPAAPPKPKPTP